MSLTEKQQKFIELSKQSEDLKKQLKEVQSTMESILLEMGTGTHFQDRSDGTVFEVIVPDGTFVSFKKIDYVRTKREGEARGGLAATRAKELGYKL
jgi:hypothetical protein